MNYLDFPLFSINNTKTYFYNESHWLKLNNNSKVEIKKNDIVKFKFNNDDISGIKFFDHRGKAVTVRNIVIDNNIKI